MNICLTGMAVWLCVGVSDRLCIKWLGGVSEFVHLSLMAISPGTLVAILQHVWNNSAAIEYDQCWLMVNVQLCLCVVHLR